MGQRTRRLEEVQRCRFTARADSESGACHFLGLLASLSALGLAGCGHAIPVAATFRGDAGIAADANVRGAVEVKLPLGGRPGRDGRPRSSGPGNGHAPQARIALIDIDGVLLNQNYGSFYAVGDNPLAGFRDKLDAAARDPQVAAVLLRINSPGGSVTTCDVMAEELRQFKAETHKPVVACLMDLATSVRISWPSNPTGSWPIPRP